MNASSVRVGAIVLCGGRSSRMGRDKASLPIGDGTMLGRVVETLLGVAPATGIVCVAAQSQTLPPLPGGIEVVHDAAPEQGPLAALGWGLRRLSGRCDAAIVTGCDAPLLAPALLRLMLGCYEQGGCVVPAPQARRTPLPGVYAVALADEALRLVGSGRRSLLALLDGSPVRELTDDVLRGADPELASLLNCNTEAEYQLALRWCDERSRGRPGAR